MEIFCFLANVRQCNIDFSVVHALVIMLKNVLRTFEAEILKIFKTPSKYLMSFIYEKI